MLNNAEDILRSVSTRIEEAEKGNGYMTDIGRDMNHMKINLAIGLALVAIGRNQ
jgi:hypothetical protein